MRRLAILPMLLLLGAQTAAAADLWIHVRVVKNDFRKNRVLMNLPLSAIEKALPLIPDDDNIEDARIEIDGHALTAEALTSAVDALRNAAPGQNVRVATFDGTFDVTREGADLVFVSVSDRTKVRLPFAIAESAARDDQIDLRAVVRSIVQRGAGNVIAVDSNEAHVEIWVDANPGMR